MKPPAITVRSVQRVMHLEVDEFQAYAVKAVTAIWPYRKSRSDILSVRKIAVSIISDRAITRLHAEFSGEATPTDVLTFQHGDIVVSVETAARHAQTFYTTTSGELRLYILHGLLHLCGFDDANPRARRQMKTMQDRLFRELERQQSKSSRSLVREKRPRAVANAGKPRFEAPRSRGSFGA